MKLAVIIFTCACFIACNSSNDNKPIQTQTKAKVSEKKEQPFSLNYPEIKYNLVSITDVETRTQLINKYKDTPLNAAYLKTLRTLNRKELQFFRVGQSVIVPDSVINDIRAYSIFPDEYKGAQDIPKVIIICNAMQAYACYEYGKLVRFAAANTGKERTPTFPGRYALAWKQRLRLSSLDSNWVMPYTFNFHQYAGNAMHQFAMPGRPVSHSCVRQFDDDAQWIFSWGEKARLNEKNEYVFMSGTPLIILNMFDYTRKTGGPWLDLASNKSYYVELPDKPMEVEEALIPFEQIPKSSRGVLPNRKRYVMAQQVLRDRGIIREGVTLIETFDFNEQRRKKAAQEAKEKAEHDKKNHPSEQSQPDSSSNPNS